MPRPDDQDDDLDGGLPMTASELDAAMEAWVGTEGYPAEYRLSAILKSAGFDTRRGLHVYDESTAASLEIDVQAACNIERAGVHVIAESKVIPQHRGWLFFSGERPTPKPAECLLALPMSPLASAARWLSIAELGQEAAQGLEALTCAAGDLVYGAKTVTFKKKNNRFVKDSDHKDRLYSQIDALIRRADLLTNEGDRIAQQRNSPELKVLVCPPLLVADGDGIFVFRPPEDEQQPLRRTQHAQLMWMSGGEVTYLNVCTQEALKSGLASKLFAASKLLAERLRPFAERIVRGFNATPDKELARALDLDVEHPEMIAALRRKVRGQTL